MPLVIKSRTSGLSSASNNLTVFAPVPVIVSGPAQSSCDYFWPQRRPRENYPRDFHPFIEGFTHVVDREGRGSNSDQGFHFHAGLGGRSNFGANFHAILAQASSHINVREREGMTKRYPLGGAFGSGNARDSRHFEGVAFGIAQAFHFAQHCGAHFYKALSQGRSRGHGLFRDVDHPDFAACSKM